MHTDSAKERAARAGAELVRDGMFVGLGSGTTAALLIRHFTRRVAAQGTMDHLRPDHGRDHRPFPRA